MAEMIFKHLAKENGVYDELDISSAAVSFEEEGNGIYPPAAAKLKQKGISISKHRAHRITVEEARDADLILIMDSSNERLLSRIIPDCDKVYYLMEFAGGKRQSVSDPWYTGDFETAYQDIYKGCKALLRTIFPDIA